MKSFFHLVDLAGSERKKKSDVSGERFSELKAINLSLSTLERCIVNLSKSQVHCPFRDSTLTKVLKSSFDGKGHTTMIATCSLANDNIQETLSTLRFASRACSIDQADRKINAARLALSVEDSQERAEGP